MTCHGIQPRSPGPLANTFFTTLLIGIYIYIYIYISVCVYVFGVIGEDSSYFIRWEFFSVISMSCNYIKFDSTRIREVVYKTAAEGGGCIANVGI